MKRNGFKPRGSGQPTIFQTLRVLAAASFENTAVIYVSIVLVRDLCSARNHFY